MLNFLPLPPPPVSFLIPQDIVCCLWTKGREKRRGDMPHFGGRLGGNLRKCGIILRNGNTVRYFTDLRTNAGRYS